MTPAQQNKFNEFKAIREAVGKTTLLSSIFDEPWFKEARPKIEDSPLPGMRAATPFFHGLPHPLLDTDRFNTVLALLDRRLKAFAELPFRQEEVNAKIKLLRKRRSEEDFPNHFFEINVLGDFALKDALRDIEVLPDDEKSPSSVDGVIYLHEREIFIEVTRQVVPRFTGDRVMTIDTEGQIKQVVRKLREKIAKGRQLALAKGSPTLLFLARTYYGADRLLAEIAIKECFRSNEFAGLSGVVLADSWKFQITSWCPGVTPDIPLIEVEKEKLRDWYAKR